MIDENTGMCQNMCQLNKTLIVFFDGNELKRIHALFLQISIESKSLFVTDNLFESNSLRRNTLKLLLLTFILYFHKIFPMIF